MKGQRVLKNRIGQRIGALTVIDRAENVSEGDAIRARWLCRCDCGNEITVSSHSLRHAEIGKGGTRSCGCLIGRKSKHGMAETRIYRVWNSMRQRCSNNKSNAFRSYGGRGITVCERWQNSFEAFFEDMGTPPRGHTLDRINNDKGYSKENCRWVTRRDQGNNRRTNVYIEYAGKRLTLSQWARETGISRNCIQSRIGSGWSVERILSGPKKL